MADQKMDPEWKAKWLEALRSGKYTQTKGKLRVALKSFDSIKFDSIEIELGFCCLGVLREIAPKEFHEEKAIGGEYVGERLCALTGLPNYFPMKFIDGCVTELAEREYNNQPQVFLAHLNDGSATFAQIADWIEANL